jgi:serine/threonine protein kinase
MTPERWRRIEQLYYSVRTRPNEHRAAFLADACAGDDTLRREVQSLLDQPEPDDEFLAGPVAVLPAPFASDHAPLTGHMIGDYRLEGMLGAGGMGDVYRAQDSRLGREVAIKVLPRGFTSDPDRLARFEREARMLAALNHPNICIIYGLEEVENLRFLILELVDGDTLADTVAHARRLNPHCGGLPLPQVIAIGRQIADALEAAHDKGIVHRDLKPANVKITSTGTVKVLDFGLAKPVTANGSAPSLTHAPRPTGGGSSHGTLIGTAAYMSPEQARGLPVDKRTDIWAFGCLLYEMLTGRVAFGGETASDSIARILERDPEWSALPGETPAHIRRLLLRCLAKDPKKRLRDIADVRIELEEVAEELPLNMTPLHRVGGMPRWRPWAVTAALAVSIAIWEVARTMTRDSPHDVTGQRDVLADLRFSPLTNWSGSEESAEISADGRFVAFLSDRDGEVDVWWGQIGGGTFRNLTANMPPLNPPSILRVIGFSHDPAELWIGGGGPTRLMRQTGGALRPFLNEGAKTPAWSPDGTRLVYFTDRAPGEPLSIADADGTDARPIAIDTAGAPDWSSTANALAHNHNPVWSLDNKWIYFARGVARDSNQQTDDMDLWRVAAAGGAPERLTYLNTNLTFLTAVDVRTLLFVARAQDGSGPWLWTLDVVSKGPPRRIGIGLEHYTSVSASRDGQRIVATRANSTASLWTVPILAGRTTDANVRPYPVESERALAPRFSGSSLFYLSSGGMGDGLWRFQDGKAFELLKGTDGALFDPPAPSRDGRRVAVVRKRDGRQRLTVLWANGTEPRTLAPAIEIQGMADWSPQGDWIVAGGRDAAGRTGLFKIPVDGGDPVRLVEGEAVNPIWSSDGALIVYGGAFTAGSASLSGIRPDGTPVQLPHVRVRPGAYRFLGAAVGLVYLTPESRDFSLLDLRTGKTRPLTSFTNKGGIVRTFDVTPDGKHIVFDRSRQNADVVLIELSKE